MGKIIKIGFYAIGTFLLFFSSIIVGANFYKDSGVFDKAVVEVNKQSQTTQSQSNKKIIADNGKDKGEGLKEVAENTPSQSTVNNQKLVIEIINCTDKSGLADEIRTMLEAKGYKVSAGNSFEGTEGTSQILIRKKGAIADTIRDTLRISVIKEELQPESRFDVTIILGSDFNP